MSREVVEHFKKLVDDYFESHEIVCAFKSPFIPSIITQATQDEVNAFNAKNNNKDYDILYPFYTFFDSPTLQMPNCLKIDFNLKFAIGNQEIPVQDWVEVIYDDLGRRNKCNGKNNMEPPKKISFGKGGDVKSSEIVNKIQKEIDSKNYNNAGVLLDLIRECKSDLHEVINLSHAPSERIFLHYDGSLDIIEWNCFKICMVFNHSGCYLPDDVEDGHYELFSWIDPRESANFINFTSNFMAVTPAYDYYITSPLVYDKPQMYFKSLFTTTKGFELRSEDDNTDIIFNEKLSLPLIKFDDSIIELATDVMDDSGVFNNPYFNLSIPKLYVDRVSGGGYGYDTQYHVVEEILKYTISKLAQLGAPNDAIFNYMYKVM